MRSPKTTANMVWSAAQSDETLISSPLHSVKDHTLPSPAQIVSNFANADQNANAHHTLEVGGPCATMSAALADPTALAIASVSATDARCFHLSRAYSIYHNFAGSQYFVMSGTPQCIPQPENRSYLATRRGHIRCYTNARFGVRLFSRCWRARLAVAAPISPHPPRRPAASRRRRKAGFAVSAQPNGPAPVPGRRAGPGGVPAPARLGLPNPSLLAARSGTLQAKSGQIRLVLSAEPLDLTIQRERVSDYQPLPAG